MSTQTAASSPLGWTWPVGRILLAALFLISGLLKFAFHGPIAGAIAAKGLPAADLAAWAAAVFEVAGAIALITGTRLVEAAFTLGAWCLLTAVVFHPFWAEQGLQQQGDLANFLKNIALIGALIIVAGEARRRAAAIA